VTAAQLKRFWSRGERTASGCLLWTGQLSEKGYGKVLINGRRWRVHRLALALVGRELTPGMQVCHSCDVRRCYEPSHLWLGRNLDNVADAMRKRRIPVGTSKALSKLTESAVREKRQKRALGVGPSELAREFGVSSRTIRDAANHVTWRHVS